MSRSLPENIVFPWNVVTDLTAGDPSRGIGIALSAIHDQLCVNADLLRELIGETRALS